MQPPDYNATIPLDAQVIERNVMLGYSREKIAFTSCTGERIAGWFARPKVAGPPLPCILVLHGAGTTEDSWWSAENPTGPLVPRLLENGYAVFMLEASSFGKRPPPGDLTNLKNSSFTTNWRRGFRDLVNRTTSDYRRALDYLETRAEIDPNRSGIVGYSMGGVMATNLLAAEIRLKAGVLCVAPPMIKPGSVLSSARARLAVIAPEIEANMLANRPLLFLMARHDIYFSAKEAEGLVALVPGSAKHLKFFDSGHQLPPAYVDDAIAWMQTHLK